MTENDWTLEPVWRQPEHRRDKESMRVVYRGQSVGQVNPYDDGRWHARLGGDPGWEPMFHLGDPPQDLGVFQNKRAAIDAVQTAYGPRLHE